MPIPDPPVETMMMVIKKKLDSICTFSMFDFRKITFLNQS